MSMGDFALVAEGVTDQLILKQILLGFFQAYTEETGEDPIINFEQPPLDETSRHGEHPPAGWSLVFKYFKDGRFKQALQTNRYLIIQIDTDVCEEYGVARQEDGKCLSPDELVDRVIARFWSLIDEDFRKEHGERFLFAVAVDEIECWLLPLILPESQKQKQGKTTGCLETLNHERTRQNEPRLSDPQGKKYPDVYRRVVKPYGKNKELLRCQDRNPSLKRFIQELEQRRIRLSPPEK
jgi:hypothetical protein